MPLTILHDDAAIVAVDKPPGLPSIPARDEDPAASVHKLLESQLSTRLWVVHRIDRDTSGVLLFARTAAAHRALSSAFESRQAAKRYLAFTISTLSPPSGAIDLPLHEARKGKSRPALPSEPHARPARTDYQTLQSWSLSASAIPPSPVACCVSPVFPSLVECRPLTGRHHQIRVHLRSRNAPILGDPLYGKHTLTGALAAAPCPRLALHASRLDLSAVPGFTSTPPITAPLPPDLVALSTWLTSASHAHHP